jgi:hypothetical protein
MLRVLALHQNLECEENAAARKRNGMDICKVDEGFQYKVTRELKLKGNQTAFVYSRLFLKCNKVCIGRD